MIASLLDVDRPIQVVVQGYDALTRRWNYRSEACLVFVLVESLTSMQTSISVLPLNFQIDVEHRVDLLGQAID